MLKVLVSGVGGDVAQGVIKCLNSSSIEIEIYKIAGDSNVSHYLLYTMEFRCRQGIYESFIVPRGELHYVGV